MRAAWAGLSGLRKERFQAALDDPDTFGTLISYNQACMKCLESHLLRWGCAAVAACCILEGPEGRVILLGWRSNMERSGLFSSRNWLSRHDIQLGIKLFQDMVAGAT